MYISQLPLLALLEAVHDSQADKWSEGCLHPSTFTKRAFLLSSLLFLCIRPSLSTQVHLKSPQFANCPPESTKMSPCSAPPYQLWQQLVVFALPVARCLPAPPSPPSESFLWEGTTSCQCGEEHGHKKGIQQGTVGLRTKAAALRVMDSKRATTTVSPQQCHHKGQDKARWRSEEGV